MDVFDIDNDTRGWIMAIVSGIACAAGACVVCVDIPIRLLPSKRNFRIQESNTFLACSLSLSFGVMLFSALYSMLPSAIRYLIKAEWEEQTAGLVMMALFVGGFIGIQAVSRLLHQFMPSHVVDCDHTHQDQITDDAAHARGHANSVASREQASTRRVTCTGHDPKRNEAMDRHNSNTTEATPLLPDENEQVSQLRSAFGSISFPSTSRKASRSRSRADTLNRRPSMLEVRKRVVSFVKDTKANCHLGSCKGFSDPCAQECFKYMATQTASNERQPGLLRKTTISGPHPTLSNVSDIPEQEVHASPASPPYRTSRAQSHESAHGHVQEPDRPTRHTYTDGEGREGREGGCGSPTEEDVELQHHHHVPTNAFLSIGLQTVIAIALHKFPEGFITYATNHANPSLGFNVFMALFVHNIAEGFAMALPLYLALGSRLRAIMWSSLLGGLSQPAGAGIAMLWFKLAKHSNLVIDNTAYACLFAATAGIMTSVALQLFVESLSLNHDRNLSIFCAFLGMTLLGTSSALVSD